MNRSLRSSMRVGNPVTRQGMTLVELLLSVAIVAVLLAVAVPSMHEFIMRKKVEGAADELLTDVRFARASLARANRHTLVKFSTTKSGDTCYVVYQPTGLVGCDCANTPVCSSLGASTGVELKTVRFATSSNLTVKPVEGSRTMLQLDAPVGIPTDGGTVEISITAPSGGEIRLITNATGRAHLCSVSGHSGAYPACPESSS